MSADLEIAMKYDQTGISGSLVTQSNAAGEAMARRQMASIQASVLMAKQWPRTISRCIALACKEMEDLALAEMAVYAFPRGGQTVSGPSIRLLEVAARHFTNLNFGWSEVQRMDGSSLCEAFCWDLEANNPHPVMFIVNHTRDKRGGAPVPLVDERDIYEKIANYAIRRMRSCIERHIPNNVIVAMIAQAKKTIEKGDPSQPWDVRLANMQRGFMDLGVTEEMLSDYLGKPFNQTTKQEFADLYAVFVSIKDGQARVEDFFKFRTADRTNVAEQNAKAEPANKDAKRAQALKAVNDALDKKQKDGWDIPRIENEILKASFDSVQNMTTQQLTNLLGVLSK